MEKKISNGTIIFGIIFLLSLFTGGSDKIFLNFQEPTLSQIKLGLKIISVIGLFAVIGLLMGKELGRKIVLAVTEVEGARHFLGTAKFRRLFFYLSPFCAWHVHVSFTFVGNIVGTYFGIVTAQLCWLASG